MNNPKTVALLRSLFAIDEEGNVFLRVTEAEPQGKLKNAVAGHNNRSLETLLSSAIVLDENKNPALRLAPVKFGMTLEAAEKDKRAKAEKDLAEFRAAQEKQREEDLAKKKEEEKKEEEK